MYKFLGKEKDLKNMIRGGWKQRKKGEEKDKYL